MRWTEPLWLLLLIPVIGGLIFSWRYVHGMTRARKRWSFALRFLMVALVVVALAGPRIVTPNRGLGVVFVLDVSDSIRESDRERAQEFIDDALDRLGPDDSAGVVVFGAEPAVESTAGGRRTFGDVRSVVETSSTDVAAALRLAAATLPEGKARRIVLLSDGNETQGDAVQAAEVAATDGVPIDVVNLGAEQAATEVALVDVQGPGETRADQPFEVRIVIDATTPQTALLTLERDGTLVSRRPVELVEGRNAFVVTERLPEAGFFRYRATLEPAEDTDLRNNLGAGFVTVQGRPRILVLQNDLSQQALTTALQQQGLEVDLRSAATAPVRPEEFQGYDAIVLNDFNAQYMAETTMRTIRAAVRDSGVGLAMIGGENSFLPGGWYGTPVAEALPVSLDVRQRKTFPSTSVLVVVDASGSMAMVEDGVQKIQLAARAAEQTVQLLSPLDRVGVAGSSDGIQFVAPMLLLDDKPKVQAEIRKIRPGAGGIFAEPSMKFARETLMKETSKVRHFILLADGNDVDTYGESLQIAAEMRANKITTSVVAIGDGKDVAFLQTLAQAGGGRFYQVEQASRLPAIFTQDVALMSRSAIEEGAFVPKVTAGEPILRGIASGGIPPLYAYCLTDVRALAQTGMRTGKDDPLLATWQFGLGNTLAFTSDAQPRWAAEWVPWGNFGRFWGQAIRSIARRATTNDYALTVSQDGARGKVEVRATDPAGNPLPLGDAVVRVAAPDGESTEVTLTQEGPGLFLGEFEAGQVGSYIVTVAETASDGTTGVTSSGFSVPYPPEYRSFRANTAVLARVAELSGGQTLSEAAEALRPVERSGESSRELWPWLVLAAALLLPVDVGLRRIMLPFREVLDLVTSRLRRRREEEDLLAPQGSVLDRLKSAKQRVTPDTATPPPTPTPEVRPPAAPPPKRAPRPANPGTSASTGLLEAKRKRRDGE